MWPAKNFKHLLGFLLYSAYLLSGNICTVHVQKAELRESSEGSEISIFYMIRFPLKAKLYFSTHFPIVNHILKHSVDMALVHKYVRER